MTNDTPKPVRILPKEPPDPSAILDKIGDLFSEVGTFLKRLSHIAKGGS